MTNDEDQDDPTAVDELYSVFASLREHVVEVVDDFAERVVERIETMKSEGRFERPSLLGMLFSTAVQMLNIVASDPEHEGDDDEPR